jgi:hypothetical protein
VKPHHFYVAPAPGNNFYVAPAPTLLRTGIWRANFLEKSKTVIIRVGIFSLMILYD